MKLVSKMGDWFNNRVAKQSLDFRSRKRAPYLDITSAASLTADQTYNIIIIRTIAVGNYYKCKRHRTNQVMPICLPHGQIKHHGQIKQMTQKKTQKKKCQKQENVKF